MKRYRSIISALVTVLLAAGLAACSTIPENLRLQPEPTLGLNQLQEAPLSHKGETVRWGGVIVSTENTQSDSRIELVAYPLSGSARPMIDDTSQGRFIAVVNGFVDPLVYTKGREMTVVGKIEDRLDRKIGEYTYHYPVVKVSTYTLWPERKEEKRYYDPFWDYPWYPYYYPYPYRYWHPPPPPTKKQAR